MNKYNLLFIFSDQHRACDLNCYGNKQIKSPNFDKLSSQSLQFYNCISNTPVCVPIRGSILTGYHPNSHKALTNDMPIDIKIKSIADVLTENNYNTGYIGKWHLGSIPRNRFIDKHERMGFKEWKVANCTHDYNQSYYYDEDNKYYNIKGYESNFQTDLALDFIERNNNSVKPWALYLSFGPPHNPYQTAPEYFKKIYENLDIRLRDNVKEQTIVNLKGKKYLNKNKIIESYKGYYSHITALDDCLGRLMSKINKLNISEKTIIVYTSDHGDMLGSHGHLNKQQPWYESINVPLLISLPRRIIPQKTMEIISLTDLPTTILGILKLKFDDVRHGHDLHTSILDQKIFKGLDSTYISNPIPCHQGLDAGIKEWYGIKTKEWTYVETLQKGYNKLYNDIYDKFQLENLIYNNEYSETLSLLKIKLHNHMKKVDDEFIPWKDVIIKNNLVDEWNSSQRWFKRPIEELI
mgnify:FL=1